MNTMNLSKLASLSVKEQAEVIRSIDTAQIQGRGLRRRLTKLQGKQGGFTLLELLVVVAILAVLGGLAIGAYGDKTSKAAKAGATNSIAAVDSMVRSYQATALTLPSNMDTLVCADTALANPADYGGGSDLPGVSGGMSAKINGKLSVNTLPTGMVTALVSGGVGTVRYGLVSGTDSACDSIGTGTIAAPAATPDLDFGAGFGIAATTAYPNSPLENADIPNRGFDFSNGGNRGRGFAARIGSGTAFTTAVPVQVWGRGANGVNNTKLGAGKNDVLVAMGIGNSTTMISDTVNAVAASAPFYGDVPKDKYGRYLMLVKVGTATPAADANTTVTQAEIDTGTALSKAKFVTVVDARGDFLDEEYAEATGQKL